MPVGSLLFEVIPLTKVKKTCRICGKEYTPCSYCESDQMAFHYRTICCSADCARIYLAKVLDARKQSDNNKTDKLEPSDEVKTSGQGSDAVKKIKYTRKKKVEDGEQIEKSVGVTD